MGKELFDDPLLSVDNVKKLADYMQWSFKYTKVNLLLLLFAYVKYLVTSDLSCFVLVESCQSVFLEVTCLV